MLLLAVCCLFFCCPNKEFSCEDISAVTHVHLMHVLYILSPEHFSDAWCKSSSLININNKIKSQTKKGDETLSLVVAHIKLLITVRLYDRADPYWSFCGNSSAMGLELLIKGFFLSAISLAQLKSKSQNVHYRYFMDVIFAKSLGRCVICGFLSSTECEYSVSLCNENVNAYCTLWDKLEFFHFFILVFTMLIFSFK